MERWDEDTHIKRSHGRDIDNLPPAYRLATNVRGNKESLEAIPTLATSVTYIGISLFNNPIGKERHL
jgi:hypothetical protein